MSLCVLLHPCMHSPQTYVQLDNSAHPHPEKYKEYVNAGAHTHIHTPTFSSVDTQTEQGHCGHLCEQQCWMFALETALATSNTAPHKTIVVCIWCFNIYFYSLIHLLLEELRVLVEDKLERRGIALHKSLSSHVRVHWVHQQKHTDWMNFNEPVVSWKTCTW